MPETDHRKCSSHHMDLPAETLYHRHRLSRQQINDRLGGQPGNLIRDEKIRQLSKVAEFLEVAKTLEQAGIWFVPYKGPLLSHRIYGDPTCRLYKDFDFLVRPEGVDVTIGMLRQLGYHSSLQWPSSPARRKWIISLTNQISFCRAGEHTPVEVHWDLLKVPVARSVKMAQAMQEHLVGVDFAGQRFRQFSLEFELLQLLIHGGLHTWSRLKWLLDIREILNRFPIDGEQFESLVGLFRAQRLAALCNGMLTHFFPGTLLPGNYAAPAWFFDFAMKQARRETAVPNCLPHDRHTFRRFHIQAFTGRRYRLTRRLLFATFWLQQVKARWWPHRTIPEKADPCRQNNQPM